MPVRYDDPRPPFEQLADELRRAIRRGDYQPGDRLPSTAQLAEDNGISPMTVQHAIGVLRDEGLVVGQKGRGVYVQDPQESATEAEAKEATMPVDRTLEDTRRLLDEIDAKLGTKADDLGAGRASVADSLEAARQALRDVDAMLDQVPEVGIEPSPPGPASEPDLGPDL